LRGKLVNCEPELSPSHGLEMARRRCRGRIHSWHMVLTAVRSSRRGAPNDCHQGRYQSGGNGCASWSSHDQQSIPLSGSNRTRQSPI
jgi:hypothetical protein